MNQPLPTGVHSLEKHPIHLGAGPTAIAQPEFPRDDRAMAWYSDYAARTCADGAAGRLVSQYRFTEDWAGWEMHPAGDEVVVCLSGRLTLIQQRPDGSEDRVTLAAGQYAINGPGVWHTADIDGEAQALFITAGAGTEHRPRR